MVREGSEKFTVLTKRIDVLQRLCEGPAHKRTLVEESDRSRSTIDRAVRELEELDLVERHDEGVTATVAGRLAVDHLVSFQDGLEDIVTAEAVVNPLPLDAPLTNEIVAGSEAMLATEPVPYRPLERVHDALGDARRYRAVLPSLDDPRHVRLLYEHVITENQPAELVVTADLLDTLREEFPRRMAALAEHEQFQVLVAETVPPFALGLTEAGDETTVSVVVFADNGTLHGVLTNETLDAVQWAENRYDEVRATATDETDSLLPETGGGLTERGADGGLATLGQSLSVSLEREGFVQLDVDYFRDEPVADPTTAWRAGLSLAEVHTGYAVERTHTSEEMTAGERGMTEKLRADLADGTDCVVVGPPGAGKSTVCKRVACEWYDADRGPVLYREQGRGRPFESVEDLVVTVDAAEGHTLVVVEDAVRPETNAVFEAIERLSNRENVSFLLDTRESEWLDSPEQLGAGSDLQVRNVPALDESDCERLIAHFERTAGERVDVPAEQLWADVRTEITTDDAAVSGMLLLLHRLSTYADPLSDGQTSLEEAVAALYDSVAGDELAFSLCVLANTLNAAGIGVDRDALYAVADPGEYDAVDTALEQLEGQVLFTRPDGTYRTVHESWSVTFLATLLEAKGRDAAAERVGDAVTALLSLADDGARREQIAAHVGDGQTLAAINDGPDAWVTEIVEALYALGQERPKLAYLFGDGEHDSVTLPAACPDATAEQRPVWLGRMFLAGGYYDAAERAFERLSTAEQDHAIERLLGLARVATETGRYDAAIERASECRSLVEDAARPLVRARAALTIGRALNNQGEYEAAKDHLQAALDSFEAAGDQRRAATALDQLGRASREQGLYEESHAFLERSLRRSRALGDRQGEANSHTALGTTAFGLGEYDQAREHFERGLDIARKRGNRQCELTTLKWLGTVAMYLSEYDRSQEYYERALDVARKVGNPRKEAEILGTIGLLAERVGEYDRAREFLQRGLDLAREIGNSRSTASRHNNLGLVAVRLGEHERAAEQFRAALETARKHGHRRHEANALNGLGHVARMRGAYDQARDHHESALAITRDIANPRRVADSCNKLGLVAVHLDEHETARERFEEALEIARGLDNPREETKALKGLGEIARQQGASDQARDRFEAALDCIETTGAGIETAHVRLAAARLALDCGGVDEAHEQTKHVHETFEELGATQWAGRSERLLGRVAAAAGDDEVACEHWESALERFESVDAPQDALATLRLLVERCREQDDDAVQQWRDRIRAVVADAPPSTVECHGEWLDATLEERRAD